jgi:hypothetical protein
MLLISQPCIALLPEINNHFKDVFLKVVMASSIVGLLKKPFKHNYKLHDFAF